ncbi:lactosylceramide alpha-2,3-sialyltransferase isoform 2-T2 [Salvelinus alpinus]|uniref:lactosylceramide alpha-2,3-sialyltransferase isoform X2 n=1 Tax=Salvelinus sp. IW2-2015 TaxID=2691554 RepID=UPI000CDF8FB1
MRISKRCGSNRRLLLPLMVLGLMILLAVVTLNWFDTESQMPLAWHVDPNHRKLVHSFVRGVLSNQCRPAFARKGVEARLQISSHVTDPFLWRDTLLTPEMFKYPPPFGFRDMHGKLKDVLNLLPAQPEQLKKECRRCVVMGNGGILRGLELGTLLDQFDVVIRLNSGPLRNYSKDVGNRTSIRMSYPEGSPKVWEDVDPELQFVAVVYKAVDFNWIRAMINRQRVVSCKAHHQKHEQNINLKKKGMKSVPLGLAVFLAESAREDSSRPIKVPFVESGDHQADGDGPVSLPLPTATPLGLGPERAHHGHLSPQPGHLPV